MHLKSLEVLLKSEIRSREYLIKKCWEGKRRYCIRCRSRKIYHLSDKRYRCGRCGYTFRDFSRRWIGQLNVSANKWLWIVKLFELEVPIWRMAKEAGISYPTALKAIYTIRRAIVQQAGPENQHAGSEGFKDSRFFKPSGRDGDNHGHTKTHVFGVRTSNGHVELTIVNHLTPKILLTSGIKIARRGSIACSDRFGGYDALLFYATRDLDPAPLRMRADNRIYNDRVVGFWNFVAQRFAHRYAMPQQQLPLYLKELEFRFNHRHTELFDLLLQKLVQLVPNIS